MKYILTVLFLFFFFSGFTQIYQEMPQYGYRANRMAFDSTLQIPTVCGVPTLKSVISVNKKAAVAFDSCNNRFYTYNPKTLTWSLVSGGGATPSLQDVATVGNYYANDNGDTLRLNTIDGNNKHPILWTNDQYGAQPNNILDFSYNSGFSDNVAKIKFGETSGLGTGYIEITDKQSIFKNEISTRTIIQNAPSFFNNQTTYFPLMKGGIDTLATTEDIRNSAIDTSNKFVNNIYRTSGVDSIYYTIGSTTYAIKDSVGSAGGGGGGGKIYYFNGGVNLGTFGGITMYELGDTAITGTAANFTRSTTGNIANFITDVNKPGLLQIPSGVWTIDAYLSESGGGSNHAQIYAVLEKWNGSTITAIATSPVEEITNGSSIDLYTYAISVPTTTLSATDRIVIQFYIQNTNGKTVTLYTQNGYVGEVHTTFTTGIGALNGLTASTQTFATGTSGTDFNISSATSTHTFNLPTASATNRGALSSANWSTFNSKLGASDTVSLSNRINLKLNISDTANKWVNNISRTVGKDSIIFNIGSTRYAIKDSVGGGGASYTFSTGLTNSSGTVTSNLSTGVSGGQSVVGGTAASNSLTLSSTTNATKGKLLFGTSAYDEVNNRLGIGVNNPQSKLWISDNTSVNANLYNSGTQFNISGTPLGQMRIISAENTSDFGGYSVFTGIRSRGTLSSPTPPLSGDAITALLSNAYDGTASGGGTAGVYFLADANVSAGNAPQRIQFSTSTSSNLNRIGRLTIKPNGNVIITASDNPTDAGYKLDVNGTARANQFQLSALNTAPATSTSTGTTGEIRIVNGFIYVCVATNTWQRATLSTF